MIITGPWYVRRLVACKCEYEEKRRSTCPALNVEKEKPYEFLHSLQIRLDQNMLLTCAVVGAGRLMSRQIYRSTHS